MDADKNDGLDLIWGITPIARVINRTPRQTQYLISTGQLPAKNVGRCWVAKRAELDRFFQVERAS